MITEGVVAFANLTETEKFQGQDTGAYSLTLTLSDEEAKKLEDQGIKLRSYEGHSQRKFKTKYNTFDIVDVDGEPVSNAQVRYGATVRVQWKPGQPHPVHGVTPYLQKVRVLEFGDNAQEDDEEF